MMASSTLPEGGSLVQLQKALARESSLTFGFTKSNIGQMPTVPQTKLCLELSREIHEVHG